jgi:hypothetical protein
VEDALEQYERRVRQVQEACADPWFSQKLARYRAGDDEARLLICGSCLGLVLDLARARWRPGTVGLLELVQEGNVALAEALATFQGRTAQEFLWHLTAAVEKRLRIFTLGACLPP